jgi:hypothetical protein
MFAQNVIDLKEKIKNLEQRDIGAMEAIFKKRI